jgi:hypothetical protein
VISTNVLAPLFDLADRLGTLKRNPNLLPSSHISLYVDDVVIFAEPEIDELTSIK